MQIRFLCGFLQPEQMLRRRNGEGPFWRSGGGTLTQGPEQEVRGACSLSAPHCSAVEASLPDIYGHLVLYKTWIPWLLPALQA